MTGTGFPPKVRAVIDGRSDGLCEVCGDAPGQEYHHRRPRGMGGSSRGDTNTAANCLLICSPCHRLAESHRALSLLMGWLIPNHQLLVQPTSKPVMYRGEWAILEDDGTVIYELGTLC